jgi:hypothetical protein
MLSPEDEQKMKGLASQLSAMDKQFLDWRKSLEGDEKIDPFTTWYKSVEDSRGYPPTPKEMEDYRRSGASQINIGTLKPMSGETAGKFAMLNQGARHVLEVEKLLFPDGEFDRVLAAGAKYGLPGGKAQMVRSAISNAINAKLRAETGAAATESEMNNMLARFEPNPIKDNTESAKKKMRDLWEFLDEAAFYIDPNDQYGSKYKDYKAKSILGKPTTTVVERRKAKDGTILEKMSDGSIRKAQ